MWQALEIGEGTMVSNRFQFLTQCASMVEPGGPPTTVAAGMPECRVFHLSMRSIAACFLKT